MTKKRRKQETMEAPAGLPVLDERAIMERVDGNRDLLREVVELFLDAYPRQQAELGAAIAGGATAEVARVAHAIKGSVAFFTSGPVVDLARSLEVKGRAGDLEAAQPTFDALAAAMERLVEALTRFAAGADGPLPPASREGSDDDDGWRTPPE
jgi:HPt (histidine-containing phosphotransfer) domain-containing protein